MDRTTDERQIDEVVSRLEAAWNATDGPAFAAPFAADADFTVFDGKRLTGRDEIAKDHAHSFATGKHMSVNYMIEGDGDRATVRVLVVVFEGEQAPVRVATCTTRDDLRKADGRWRIVRHKGNTDPSMTANVGQKS